MSHPFLSRRRPILTELKRKRGQTLVEYALVLSFISVLTIVVMSSLGIEVRGIYAPIINALDQARMAIQ